MTPAYVVSDLHMFCRRSRWQDHLDQIDAAAQIASLFVFNGDTVDFKWSCYPSTEETVGKASEFFRDFATRHPHCQVHVNLGNHDHVQLFMDALDALAADIANFTWHPYYLRVNNTLFLHGDVAMRKMSHDQLEQYRAGWLHFTPQSETKNRVWDAAFRAKAHLAISRLAFPPRRTLRRVAAYLNDIGHSGDDGIEYVYFGHTHVPMRGHRYRGVTFHNGGAPMEGIDFSLLKAVV